VAAAALLEAPREHAIAIALLRAGGVRAAFGSDGKSIQVGMAASSGVAAARLAAAGARVPLESAVAGFELATGGRWAEPDPQRPAVAENWIKPWPCCLQTHGAIEAAEGLRGTEGPLTVVVHPVSLQAAGQGPDPADGLQAKFSIPYLTAYTLLHGPPRVDSFASVDAAAVERAQQIEVCTDTGQRESEFAIYADGSRELARVGAARGSPERPLDAAALRAKVESLTGERLAEALDDLDRPAAEVLELAGLA
jgi:2-methylcitrate dehydratase PrpD